MMTLDERRSGIILDNHPLWLEALEVLLLAVGIDVVARATTAEEALGLLAQHEPDLFVADLHRNGGLSGAACVREVARRFPALKIIVLSGDDDPASVEEAFSAGAAAFVSKSALPEDLGSAVRQVFTDSVFLANHHPSRAHRPTRQSERLPGLTRREAEVLELVAKGYSNVRVAKMLWVTEQTVKFHLSNIYRKLGVANRTEAAHWALVRELGSRSDLTTLPAASTSSSSTSTSNGGTDQLTLGHYSEPPEAVAWFPGARPRLPR
jgi:DNA-binding NarL/FixJ family response regulator